MSLIVREFTASVEALHAIPMPTSGSAAELWIMRPVAPALAMGSSQQPELFDVDRLRRDGVQLASRRSGGGAVFIEPGATVWVDLVAPKSSVFYSHELSENFLLVGRRWQAAFASFGITTVLCDESGGRTAASALACWAGLGWGELTVGNAKIVGLSQRRTRWGSRVQAMAVLDGSSVRVADYFAGSAVDLVAEIEATSVAVTPDALELAVVAAFTALAG